MLLRKVKDKTYALGDTIDHDLPKDSTLKFVDVFTTATVTGAGGGADIGAHNIIAEMRLVADNINIFDNGMTGREHYYLSGVMMGELMEEDAVDPSGGSVTLFTLHRLWLENPRGLNPERTRLNVRPFEDFRIRGTFAAATSAMYSGGTQVIAAGGIRQRIFYGETPGSGGDAVQMFKRFDYVFDGSEQTFDWRETGANLRAVMLSEFESNDTASDDELESFELVIDGKVRVIEPLPGLYLRAKSAYASELSAAEIPTGLSYHDLDPRSKGDARVNLSGNNTQIKIKGEVDSKLSIIRVQTVGVETFGVAVKPSRGRRVGRR